MSNINYRVKKGLFGRVRIEALKEVPCSGSSIYDAIYPHYITCWQEISQDEYEKICSDLNAIKNNANSNPKMY